MGSLITEQNHLRDIHSEMDMLSVSHPTYPSLLQNEMDSLTSMHACLFDVDQHDRRDHNYYLDLKANLQNNFEAEKQSERRARKVLLGAILGGVGCGILFVFITTKAFFLLRRNPLDDSLLSSYAVNEQVDEFKRWIREQNVKINFLLNDIAKNLKMKRSGGVVTGASEGLVGRGRDECWEGDEGAEDGIKDLIQLNKELGEEMKVFTEALKQDTLPVLEVAEGGKAERGLWITTLSYFCAAVVVPVVAYMAS